MKKANFNTLKHLPVPEGWVEKALMIPEQAEKSPVVLPFWRRKGVIALAASLVLVTAVSVALFLSGGAGSPVTVKPMPSETVSATNVPGETAVPDGVLPTSASSQATGETVSLSGDDLPTDPTAPTERKSSAATENGATETRRPAPSVKPAAPSTKPTEASTESASAPPQSSPTAPTQTPWVYPTVSPTVPTWDAPTEVPTPTTAPWDQPTEVTWVDPTSAPTDAPMRLRTVSVTIPRGSLPRDKKVYCRIELSDGTVLGDYGLFAKEREMLEYGSHLYSYNVYRRISEPIYKGVSLVCYIYDSDGNILTENYYLDYY